MLVSTVSSRRYVDSPTDSAHRCRPTGINKHKITYDAAWYLLLPVFFWAPTRLDYACPTMVALSLWRTGTAMSFQATARKHRRGRLGARPSHIA